MQRIHLFEFEDYPWFPDFLRVCMTRYLVTIHKLFGTAPVLAKIVKSGLAHSPEKTIIDLCSGGGGPMPDVLDILKEEGNEDLKLTLTDLYPNKKAAAVINEESNSVQYNTTPVNAAHVNRSMLGLRTMVCSLHHMKPEAATSILKDAMESRQPICIFEISDNSIPHWIAWIAFPINIIMVFFLTLAVRPVRWEQIVFTYLIPLLPLFIAWDGMVSNMRTYTLGDLKELTGNLKQPGYEWQFDTVEGKGGKKIFLLGLPQI